MTAQIVEGLLPPGVESLGLLSCVDSETGEHLTAVASGEYLRALFSGTVEVLDGMRLPDADDPGSPILPGFIPGWADEWAPDVFAEVTRWGRDADAEGWDVFAARFRAQLGQGS